MEKYDGSVTIGVLADTDPAEKSVQGLGDKLKSGFSAAAKVASAAIGAATTAVTAFAASSVNAGMQFDTAMSQVAATMGKTTDEIGDLRDFAMEMGANTAFSATEAADALNYMALAGYNSEQSMQALPNVLNLAAASDMVTDAQSALGLSMEESAELVDKMAMASSKSNTSVAQLGDAILTIGGTAKNLAGGTTELSTALGILADNGVKGAEGGTALRNIILSLSAPTNTAAKAMESLGVEVFDAEGNMRPLNDTFSDLESALSTMTQGEQTQVLSEIFNKVDLKSVNALLANTGERFDELSGYIDNASGSAEKMANTQLDNLAGDVTLFKSALEGAQIVLSDQLAPVLREFVQFGSSGVSEIAAAFQEGGLSGAMEAFGSILSDGLNMIIEQLPSFVDAGMQLLGALGQGLIDNLPTIAESAIKIVAMLADGIVSAFPQLQAAAGEMFNSLIGYLQENLPQMISSGLEALLSFSAGLRENVGVLVDNAIELIMTLADGIIQALPDLIATVPEIISNFANAINDNAPKLLKSAAVLIAKLVKGLIENIPVIIQNIPKIISAIVDTIQAFNWLNLGKTIIDFLAKGIKGMVSTIANAAKEVVKSITDNIGNLPKAALQWGKDLIDNFVNGIKNTIGKVKDAVVGVADTVKSFLGFSEPEKGPLSNFHTYAPDMVELFANGIEKSKWMAADAAADMAKTVSNAAYIPSIPSASIPSIARGTVTPSSQQFAAAVRRPADNGNISEQLSALMAAIQSGGNGQPINITVELDGRVVARNTVHHINDMTRQAGKPVLLY